MLVKFTYNEPRVGELDTDASLDREEIVREIERQFPEAIDIEIQEEIYA